MTGLDSSQDESKQIKINKTDHNQKSDFEDIFGRYVFKEKISDKKF